MMNRKLRSFSLLCALLLALSLLSLCVSADSADLPRVIDEADLLTPAEEKTLSDTIARISALYEFDIVILTVESIGIKSPMVYADDYYDDNGYGYGDTEDGILFLLSMEKRDWYVSTGGAAVDIFGDSELDRIEDSVIPKLSNKLYASAFTTFLSISEEILEDAAESERTRLPRTIGILVAVSLVIGLVVVLIMKYKMNNARPKRTARDYVRSGSFHLRTSRDLFLYSTIRKVRRQESSSSGGSHRSSSGSRHGGRGGKF